MPWNGSGTFNRIYSWVADKAAGLDISSTRMDADTNDITSQGFGNTLTRDGQGGPTANLPMNNFKHTGVANGSARTDYASMAQAQDGLIGWTISSGAADALVAAYTPSRGAPADGSLYSVRATAANATTTPTFAPDGQTARTITKVGGTALVPGDIPGNLAEIILRYNSANTRYELLNPAYPNALVGTGDVKLTFKTTADPGWLLFDDGTFGSATSGSSNSNSSLNQAIFTLMFNNLSDTAAPLLTSTGSATTRAGQGTAAAAWAANCRMTLPKTLGRALAVAGSGSGLTARALGSIFGEENHLLSTAEIPSHTHANTVGETPHSHTFAGGNGVPWGGGTGSSSQGGGTFAMNGLTMNTAVANVTITNVAQGGGGTHNTMQPSTFLNVMVKQ